MSKFFKRLQNEINFYLERKIEISEGVNFSQYNTIKRIMKFKNRDLSGSKIDDDLRYLYHPDIIETRVDNEIKNLRIDTKHVMPFSENPRKDFPAVFIMDLKLKDWMEETGQADELKRAIEEYVSNGNVGFKRTADGFERVDPINTYITNQKAETVEETDIIERRELTASEIDRMDEWDEDAKRKVIEECGNKTYKATEETTESDSSKEYYEIYEFTGEVSEEEFSELSDSYQIGDDKDKYFLAKIIVAGLQKGDQGENIVLFAEKVPGSMTDWYKYAHRGKYKGRFWREGMYEILFDYQVRANEIARDIAAGLEWASKVIFRSNDSKILQNIRADLVNGDIVITEDLQQVDVRLHNLDQLIADWNRNLEQADDVAHSHEVARGDTLPSGTPFRLGALLDENIGKMFAVLRQKFAITYRRVFQNWILEDMIDELSGEEIFRLTGDAEMLDRFRKVRVESWYMNNLVEIGPHTKEEAEAIKAEKMDELRDIDPVIKNAEEIWDGVKSRIKVTVVGENRDVADQMETIANLIQLESDPERRAFLLDSIYKIKGIPVPPKREEAPEDQRTKRKREAGEASEQPGAEGEQVAARGGGAMDELAAMLGEGGGGIPT